MNKVSRIKKLYSGDYYPVWLILLFISHGWRYYWGLISFIDVVKVFFILTGVVLISFGFCKLLQRKRKKAAFLTFVLLFFLLYTTSIINFFDLWTVLPHVKDQLLIILGIFLIIVIIVHKVKTIGTRFISLVNVSLGLLILLEVVLFFFSDNKAKKETTSFFDSKQSIQTAKTLPSVYLILLDEYAGSESLQRNFNFDNNHFIEFLASRKFKVLENAASNYKYTLLSLPSMFNGEYISMPKSLSVYGEEGSKQAMVDMFQNKTFATFKQLGYNTINYSPFAIKGHQGAYTNRFLPGGILLLLYPTLLDDFVEQVPPYLFIKLGKKDWLESYYKRMQDQNELLIQKMYEKSLESNTVPIFCYVHLMLPHSPYIMDSAGRINIPYLSSQIHSIETEKKAYIQSLQYTNKLMMNVIDSLKRNTNDNAVILLMSDHGYKTHAFNKREEDKFNSLNAVYMPDADTTKWYNGMSNINQFRILFSTITGKAIPLIKDSLILR